MNWKSNVQQVGLMTGIMLGVWSFVSGLLLGLMGFVNPSTFGPENALEPLPGLFLACLLNAVVIVWFVSKTHLSGYKLGSVVFLIIFGVMFFMTQIETVYFNASVQMPWQIIFSTVLTGVCVGLVVSWLAVRYKNKDKAIHEENIAAAPPTNLFWKFVALSGIYLMFYFFFGYFIAWQFPALREYYSGSTEILPFIVHMQEQIANDFGLILFQIAYIVAVNITKGKPWERVILVGLAMSIGLATPLLVPNEYMPGAIRLGHFFELLIENFLFGVIAAFLFQPNQATNN
jgi:small-conductance mechanosensitive channel